MTVPQGVWNETIALSANVVEQEPRLRSSGMVARSRDRQGQEKSMENMIRVPRRKRFTGRLTAPWPMNRSVMAFSSFARCNPAGPDRMVPAPSPTRKHLVTRLSLVFALLAALAVLASPAPVWAEVTNPNGVALIIGNTDYEHRDVPDVTFAHRDADAFRRYVVEVLGYAPKNIVDLRDATRRELFDALGTKSDPRSLLWSYLDPDGVSEVVVFYSGHGVPGVNDKRGYLLPVDADPKAAEDDGYPIDLLYRNVGGLAEARSVRVYLDACFSGGSGGGGTLIRDASPVFVEAALPEGLGEKVTSLAAATGKQVASWDEEAKHGLFTHHLLDALYGKADADGNGEVTAREVKGYLDRYMTRAARRQHRRIQQASLVGVAEVVVASAGAGGAFPARPGLGDTDSDDEAEAPVADAASEEPARADAQGTDEPAPTEAPLQLTRADKKLVQGGLLAAGLDVGVADGLFGPRTEKAIRGYQKKKGLPETGKLTPEQAEALIDLGRNRQSGTVPRATTSVGKMPPKSDPSSIVLASGMRLSDWALLAEDRLAKGEYRTLLVEGMAHIRAHGAHESVESVVERALEGLVKGVRVTDETSARSALATVKQIRGVVGQSAELAAIEAKAHRRLGKLPQAVAAYRSWLRLAPAGHPERKRMLLALQRAERGEVGPTAGEVFRDCDGMWCPELVVVPAGSYMMGSPESEARRDNDEGPRHRVRIAKPIAVGMYEVTFEEWDACRRGGGCSHNPGDSGWGRGRRPVISVSWTDAQAYVKWLSRETGESYRLLSESEWEYMARAGTTGPFHFGATLSTAQANYDGNYTYGSGRKGRYRERTEPVGSFPANAFGVHDVHGNVWEWVEDCWHDSYRGAPADGRAWTVGGYCGRRMLRGGSWNFGPQGLRSAYRSRFTAGSRSLSAGFRVARTFD